MNLHTITEKSIVAQIREATGYLVLHETPENQPAARLSALMEATEEEAQSQVPSFTVMIVRKAFIQEAIRCVNTGGIEHRKMLELLTEILQSYAPTDQHTPHKEQE